MKLTKFSLTDSQFKNFEDWFLTHYNYKLHGINLYTVNRFLGHHWGVQLLNWIDQAFVTMTPANASFFIIAMSGDKNGR